MADATFSTIVVGTDGSPAAERALERAAQLAGADGAELHLVTAHAENLGFREPLVSSAKVEAVDLSRVADEVLARAAAHARRLGVEPKTHHRSGDPADAVIRVAEETGADLIVVGSRGLSKTQRFLLGSVSHKVSQHAPCTVMVVRDDRA